MQKRYLLTACLTAAMVGVVAAGAVRPEPEATQRGRFTQLPTPTGREPRLIWTPERQAVWSQMRADFDANPLNPPTLGGRYYKLIKDNAECACRYADTGLWATLMFQITGDPRYVELAWRGIDTWFLRTSGRQLGETSRASIRRSSVLHVRLALSAAVRLPAGDISREAERNVHRRADQPSNPNAPVRTADSDQTVGVYFGLAFLFVATADHNSAALDYLHQTLRRRPRCNGARSVDASKRDSRLRRPWPRAANGSKAQITTSAPCGCCCSAPKASERRRAWTTFRR